jgi:hypothetical protein
VSAFECLTKETEIYEEKRMKEKRCKEKKKERKIRYVTVKLILFCALHTNRAQIRQPR